MTVINRFALLADPPIKQMLMDKQRGPNGVSHGLAEVGYDIRIKQTVHFKDGQVSRYEPEEHHPDFCPKWQKGRFIIASSIEEFEVPMELMGIVHDKSTWARKGLSVFNTVIEPGWNGFLTLELVYHGTEELIIPCGSGIAQVIFHQLAIPAQYQGSYQNQADMPVPSLLTKV